MLEMKVELLDHTGDPERLIALAAKLCYAGCNIEELKGRLSLDEIERFNEMLMEIGHHGPLEHASYTFGVEGVSRITEQQLTRHRIASYCLSGDSLVYTDKIDGELVKTTIKDLYEMKKQNVKLPRIRSLNENRYVIQNKIIDVTYSGKKEVFEVTTMNGFKIKSTKDHRFYTSNGWKRLEDVDMKKDYLTLNHDQYNKMERGLVRIDVDYSLIKEIKSVGIEDTYDISMEAPHHNFIANGFVVHNCIQSGRYVTRNNATYSKPRLVKKSVKASKAFDKLTKFANETYEAITTSIEADLCYNYLKINNPEAIELVKPHEEELIVEVMKNINKKEYNKFHKQAIESARAVLPNSLQTKIIFTMNTRTLINFFNHRCCTRAQEEIRKMAYMMLAILKEKFPILFGNVGASCKTKGYCPEGNMSCGIAPTLTLLLDVYDKYKDEYKASLNNK